MLAVFYLVINAGFTLNAHYCAGKMVEIEVFSKPEQCCTKSQSCHQEDPKCCDDESILVQLDEWQLPSTLPLYQVKVIFSQIIPTTTRVEFIDNQTELNASIEPPPPKATDLWLLYHKLTYYG
jgi:hypothetical protein